MSSFNLRILLCTNTPWKVYSLHVSEVEHKSSDKAKKVRPESPDGLHVTKTWDETIEEVGHATKINNEIHFIVGEYVQ